MSVEVVLWPIAVAMAAITAYLVKWAVEARTPLRAGSVLFLLGMMAAMFAGAFVYFLNPGPEALVEGLWLSAAVMAVSVFPLFTLVLREARERAEKGPAFTPPPLRRVRLYVGVAVSLVLLNEFLMGGTFLLAAGGSLLTAGAGTLDLLVSIIVSPWFLFTMAIEMALTTALLWDRLDRAPRFVLLAQAALMVLAPTAFAAPGWVAASIYVGSSVMIVLFIFLMEYIYRHRELGSRFAEYIVRLLGLYALMMAGLFLWAAYGTALLFALAIVLEMVLFFDAILQVDRFQEGERFAWQLRPNWAFQMLLYIFVAELFMGALLAIQINPGFYAATFPALPLTGSAGQIIVNALTNAFWFFVFVTASTWFLLMMGVEMGALVYFKLRETKQLETRVRLVLMMGCYGAFAVFYPSVFYTALLPTWPTGTQVPVLGWSMGLGAAPLAPAVFTVVALTYVFLGALCVLFGRRVVCSVLCTAALMYQGTTVDSMSSFNRTSPVGRKFLGTRLSEAYIATSTVVLASLVAVSFLSYFNQIGALNVTIAGADPAVFFFALSFGVLWYVLFVSIPYVGNYNCATTGWCYTGQISAAFSRVGFFRLKVRDKQVCKECTTLDCAKVCPVGLVDMPGHFRTKGQMRSAKCCGVGNCVGACPYGNLYIYDVRHWMRRRLGLPEVKGIGRPLPMVRPTPTVRAAHAAAAPPPAIPSVSPP